MFEREAEITDNRQLLHGTFLMSLKEPSIAGRAGPGRFLMIRAHKGLDPLLRRPLSICGLAGKDTLRILYRVAGRGTALLSEKKTGERVSVLGPLGNGFRIPEARPPLMLVGGGLGVAPIFSLAQALTEEALPFSLMTGFGRAGDVIRPEDVLGVGVEVETATEDGSVGWKGLVTDLLEDRLSRGAPGENPGTVCACGPPAMLKKAAESAAAAGAACLVSLEARMACGLGACLGCAVDAAPGSSRPYHRVCVDGPVFPANDIDWNKLGRP